MSKETNELNELIAAGKHVFLVGIGGIGMSALAQVLQGRGLIVSGADKKENRILNRLRASGIDIKIGHSEDNVNQVDFMIYSSAITPFIPEMKRANALGIPIYHRAEVLAHLMNHAISFAITGTHGKTTSSALASFLMRKAGFNPSCLVGGDILNYGTNVLVGDTHFFVSEVDESDRSQLNYKPDYALITNLEAEHLDVYKDLDDLKKSFVEFVSQVKDTGKIVYCEDDPLLREIISHVHSDTKCFSYGITRKAYFYAEDVVLDGFNTHYRLFEKGKAIDRVTLNIPGFHNISNSLGVVALLRAFGLEYEKFLKYLPEFSGARRRLEVKLKRDDFMIVDDYAHHPTEVKAGLRALRAMGMKICVIFQPHRFSRTAFLAEEFGHAFDAADRVILTDIYGAGEENPNQVMSDVIYQHVKGVKHPNVNLVPRNEIIDFLMANKIDHGIVVFMGAGDIGEVAEEFAGLCQNAYTV